MVNIGPAFTLAQLIEKTADELRSLRAKPRIDAVMEFKGCELELAVTLTAEAGGEIKFWLAGASAQAKGQTVSRIKLSFGPISVEPFILGKGHIVAEELPPKEPFTVEKNV
jgi:hypothetical protein